jgi:hypothetical protein
MIHRSVGASRRVAGFVLAVGAPLAAILAALVSTPARAGGGGLAGQPELRGSHCADPDDAMRGCARIKGYIAAGERFGSDDRIGGRLDPFGPINEPGIVSPRSSSGLIIMGAPSSARQFLNPAASGDIAR